MRFAAIVTAGLLFFAPASLAQEGALPAVEMPPSMSAEGAGQPPCQGADKSLCVAAISGATVAGVIAVNAVTGGAPVASIIAGLFVAHVGLEIAMLGAGSGAAIVSGVADPAIAAAGDAYATAEFYVVAAANNVAAAASDLGTAVGDWLYGGPRPAN